MTEVLALLREFLREFGVGILILVATIAIVYQLVTTYNLGRRMQIKNEADRERLRNEAQADLQEIARKERQELEELREENKHQAEQIDALTKTNEHQAEQIDAQDKIIAQLTGDLSGLQGRFEELVELNSTKDARLATLERELRLLKTGRDS